jgi:DNA polymerase/3'-5' exonuclease PolX
MYGVGPVLQKKLDKKLKGRNLENALDDPEIWALLPDTTKLYLKYKPASNVPRALMEPKVQIFEKLGLTVAGSWRRGLPTCNDFDVLIPRPLWKSGVWKKVRKNVKMIEPFACGEEIIRTFIEVKSGMWMFADFFIYDDEAPYLLYATGSKNFNKLMRGQAKKKSLLLNQHGLFRAGKKLDTPTEKSIFAALDMHWREPAERH